MAPLLHQRYSVLSLVISDANEDWLPFACDKDVFFLEYVDALLQEDGNCAIVRCLAHAHQRCGEVLECVCLSQLCRQFAKGELGDIFGVACAIIGNPICCVDGLRIGRPALHRSCLLR
jgi:hypothetical protein